MDRTGHDRVASHGVRGQAPFSPKGGGAWERAPGDDGSRP